MSLDPVLRICLEPPLLKSAQEGAHNFIRLIAQTAEKSRFRVEYCGSSDAEVHQPATENVFTLTHMKSPPDARGLTFRRVYYYPFWQIDPNAERWNWQVAKAEFDPEDIPTDQAQQFARFWKKRLFGQAPLNTTREGYIYVPLQGRLAQHRSFQMCSPLEMLKHVLHHCEGRKVIATLHPKERYSADDMSALDHLEQQYPQFHVRIGGMERLLQNCDYVVTQNSSVAFSGYFFGKPALLFARIDFHHIAVQADMTDLADSFAEVAQTSPAYDSYLWWFLQDQSINAGKADAQEKIAGRFREFGWL